MIIVAGSASQKLGKKLAEILDAERAELEVKRFPDNECYVRVREDLNNKDVVIVQNTYPDEKIIEALLILDAVRDFVVNSLVFVAPYFGYGRQDKKFNEGEAVSARVMARHLQMDADAFITVDVHSERSLQHFSIKAETVTAMGVLGDFFSSLIPSPEIIVAPDKGAINRAKTVAESLNCDWDYLEKIRIDSEHVEIAPKAIDVENKVVALVDDIISTGGTIARAAAILRQFGAKKIYVGCTHGIYVKNALSRLRQVCDRIVSTDTVEAETSAVSAAPPVAALIKKWM